MQRVLEILENPGGQPLPGYGAALNNLAMLYQATNRLKEAKPLMERQLEIFIEFTRRTGHPHPYLKRALNNYAGLLLQMGNSRNEVIDRLKRLAPEMFDQSGEQPEEE
jgi:hypothetical protein